MRLNTYTTLNVTIFKFLAQASAIVQVLKYACQFRQARQLSWLERRANNAKVLGSIPTRAKNLFSISALSFCLQTSNTNFELSTNRHTNQSKTSSSPPLILTIFNFFFSFSMGVDVGPAPVSRASFGRCLFFWGPNQVLHATVGVQNSNCLPQDI